MLTILRIFFVASIGSVATLDAHAETLRVIVAGLDNALGHVQLSLENSKESYYGDQQPMQIATVNAATGAVEYEFSNLPAGTYSLKAFHDENANSKLDLSFIGIPKESYGISNDARAALGMPSYEDAKFNLAGSQTIRVTVKKHIRF